MAAHLVSSLLLIETSFLPETRLLLRGVVKEVFRCSGKRAKWAWSLCFAKSGDQVPSVFRGMCDGLWYMCGTCTCVIGSGMCVVLRHPPTSSHSHVSAVRVMFKLHSSHVRLFDTHAGSRTLRVPLAHLTKRFTVQK